MRLNNDEPDELYYSLNEKGGHMVHAHGARMHKTWSQGLVGETGVNGRIILK
jgi:hypothetical protein